MSNFGVQYGHVLRACQPLPKAPFRKAHGITKRKRSARNRHSLALRFALVTQLEAAKPIASGEDPVQGGLPWDGPSADSACSSQNRMSISRYNVVAMARCCLASSRWPVPACSVPRPK